MKSSKQAKKKAKKDRAAIEAALRSTEGSLRIEGQNACNTPTTTSQEMTKEQVSSNCWHF